MDEERSELGLSLIKQLASSDTNSRNKALSSIIDSWLPNQSHVSEDLMKKLWKGLFYCVWHADKLPAQSQLAERLSTLMTTLDLSVSLSYLSSFLLTMRRDWAGIDVLRLDKFYLLIRRFIHCFFVLLRKNSWDLELSRRLIGVLAETTFFADDSLQGNGVNFHIASVFLEEATPFLPIRLEVIEILLSPFVSLMAKLPNKTLLMKVKANVFDVLRKKGTELLEVRKSGGDLEEGSDVVLLGSIGVSMGFSGKFYELGSSPGCHQGNRKMLLGLYEEFAKMEKDFASSGVNVSVSIPTAVVDGEDQVPDLIPVVSDEMEENVALKKCESKNESNPGDGKKKKKKKEKKKKKKVTDSSKGKSNGNGVDANGDEDRDLVTLNETAMSNLQLQFEKIAAEAGLDGTEVAKSSKKRKRGKVARGKAETSVADCVGEEDSSFAVSAKSGGKRVKFSMENNLVWKPQNPLPPQSLRLPPSATPRGSALKKGVPPGPIREIPTQPKKVKLRAVSVKKARKAVKRLKKVKTISA